MKKNLLPCFLLFVIMLFFNLHAKAQTGTMDSTKTYLVVKNDGTELIGKILSDDGRELLLLTENLGKIFIRKSDIKSIKLIEDKDNVVAGKYLQAGPFSTRYTFTTNALPIKKGENYAMVNLYGPEVHFALSDQFSLGFMSTWIASPLILAAKYSFKTENEKLNFSVGTLLGTTGYLNSFRGFGGLHFGNITYGTRSSNVTLAAGYAYLQTGGTREQIPVGVYTIQNNYPNYESVPKPMSKGPMFSIAGIVKVGAKASFVFDSMLGLFSTEANENTYTIIQEADYSKNPVIPQISRLEVVRVNKPVSLLFIMPGMRFQATNNNAIQINMAGVNVQTIDDSFSFPLPSLSWYHGF